MDDERPQSPMEHPPVLDYGRRPPAARAPWSPGTGALALLVLSWACKGLWIAPVLAVLVIALGGVQIASGVVDRSARQILLGLACVFLVVGPVVGDYYKGRRNNVRQAQVACDSNLRQIAQALSRYTAANGGAYPPALGALLDDPALDGSDFVCPTTGDTPAKGATMQAIRANFAAPGHCSYVYVGAGLLTATADGNTVIAYEKPSNHGREGIEVILGNGRVAWIHGPAVKAVINATGRPVRLPAGR